MSHAVLISGESGAGKTKGVNDVKEFWGLLEAFNTMAFKREEEDEILRIAAASCTLGTWSLQRMVMRPR